MPRHRRQFLKLTAGVAVLGVGCVGSSDQNGGGSTPATEQSTRTPTDAATTAEPTPDTTTTTRTAKPTGTPTETAITDTTSTAAPTAAGTGTGTPTETMTASAVSTPTDSGETTRRGSTEEVPVRTPLACDEHLDRLDYSIDEVRYDSLGGFELAVSETTVALGDSMTVRLENTTNTTQSSGNDEKYDIQARTDDGWQSIYWVGDAVGWTAIGIPHQPGEGFTWEFTLTPDGLEHSTQFNTPYSACGDLSPVEYRFLYWGLSPEQDEASDSEKEYAIGVRFTVEE